MKKSSSQEAYYERLRNLADVNKKSIKESQNRSLGTLIDYKRASDGVAYGIVKENHHYYLKKSGLKQDPNVSDFAYINGLANITNYQYKSLAEADKQRNMLLHIINEATTTRVSKTGTKRTINEDKISNEIGQAEAKLDAAETAVDVPEEEPMNSMGNDEIPVSDDRPIEEPAPVSDKEPTNDEMPTPEGDETPAEELTGEEGDEEPTDNVNVEEPTGDNNDDNGSKDEIKSDIGKIGNKVLQKTLNDKQVISYVNMFLGYFKDNFLNMEQSELDSMAAKINELHKEKNIEDLEKNTPTEPIDINNPDDLGETQYAKCGSFAQYAESRGYSKESLMECDEDEMSSLVGGYANMYSDNENDGDHKTVALFIKLMPKVLDILKNEYGHNDYADELESEVGTLSESTNEDIQTQIEEALGGALWGGLKSIGKGVTAPVKGAYQMGKQAVQATGQAIDKGVQNVKQAAAAQSQKQDIRTGTKQRNAYLDKVQAKASELIKLIQQANAGATKAGQEPINVGSVLSTLRNQLAGSGNVNLSKYKAEGVSDMVNTEILPENEISFTPAGQSLGVNIVKPNGTPITSEPVNEVVKKLRETIDGLVDKAKGENIIVEKKSTISETNKNKQISESEQNLRKYIRTRLEENAGLKKPIITENKKSEKLKKLDVLIENQYKLFKSKIK